MSKRSEINLLKKNTYNTYSNLHTKVLSLINSRQYITHVFISLLFKYIT